MKKRESEREREREVTVVLFSLASTFKAGKEREGAEGLNERRRNCIFYGLDDFLKNYSRIEKIFRQKIGSWTKNYFSL